MVFINLLNPSTVISTKGLSSLRQLKRCSIMSMLLSVSAPYSKTFFKYLSLINYLSRDLLLRVVWPVTYLSGQYPFKTANQYIYHFMHCSALIKLYPISKTEHFSIFVIIININYYVIPNYRECKRAVESYWKRIIFL